jgi:hypothetical protein
MSFMNFHTILTLRSALAGRMQHPSTEKIVEQQHPIAFGILRTSKGNNKKRFEFYSTLVQQAVFLVSDLHQNCA